MTTVYSSASAPSWTRTTLADGNTLSVVFLSIWAVSWRLLDRSKTAIFIHLTCIWRPVGNPIGISSILLHHGLLRGVVFANLCSANLVQHELVTDRRTDIRTHWTTAYTTLAKRRAGKNLRVDWLSRWVIRHASVSSSHWAASRVTALYCPTTFP